MSKPYTLASKRADAPTGCAYVAPLLTCAWFRWENCRDSGQYLTGAEVAAFKPTNIQIFHDGAWHPVAAFYGAVCAPVDDYLQEVGA